MSAALSSLLGIVLLSFLAPLPAPAQQLTVAAAADLAPLQGEIQTATHTRVRFVIGASGVLKQQIENGAPYDVFMSASAAYVDELVTAGKIDSGSVLVYTRGRVGVLWRDSKSHPLSDLKKDQIRSVAIPNPRLAPYGVAAVKALQEAGLWEAVSPKAVYGENVRQTYQMFESGNVDAVLTSASMLLGRPADLLPPSVDQKAGVIAASPNKTAAVQFVKQLLGPEVQAVFAAHNFGKPLN